MSKQDDMLGTSGEDNLGLVIDFATKIRNKTITTTRAKQFLRGEATYFILPGCLPVWSIEIGGVSKDELLERLKNDGSFVGGWASDMISKPTFTTLPQKQTINLVRSKVRELGFTSEPTTTELWARIKQVGRLCPAEVGPHVRLQDTDQEKDTTYWIAMEPILDSSGNSYAFRIRRNSSRRLLEGNYANPGNRWRLDNELLFVLASNTLVSEPGI